MKSEQSIQPPGASEYASFYSGYVDLVKNTDVMDLLSGQRGRFGLFIKTLNKQQLSFNYAAGKWTTAQVISHITDAERIFNFRALSLARGEKKELPGFEENDYVQKGNANALLPGQLLDEYMDLRASTLSMFNNFSAEVFLNKGLADGSVISVRAILYIIAGHNEHHINILRERYNFNIP
jgi:hypothetical protein